MTDHEKQGATVPIVIAGEAPLHDVEEREIYEALHKMNTVLELFVNALMLRNRHKRDQGRDSSSQPDPPTPLQQEWFDSAHMVLSGPLSGYFQVSSANNQGGGEKGPLARLESMKIFDIINPHLYTIKEPTVREHAQEKTKSFIGDFQKQIRTYNPSSPQLAREALCLDMLYILKRTFSGSDHPEDETDRLLQPMMDIAYAEFAVNSYDKVDHSESHDQDSDIRADVRGKCSYFKAELNMEAYQRDKSKFDEILRRAGEQHVGLDTLVAMVRVV